MPAPLALAGRVGTIGGALIDSSDTSKLPKLKMELDIKDNATPYLKSLEKNFPRAVAKATAHVAARYKKYLKADIGKTYGVGSPKKILKQHVRERMYKEIRGGRKKNLPYWQKKAKAHDHRSSKRFSGANPQARILSKTIRSAKVAGDSDNSERPVVYELGFTAANYRRKNSVHKKSREGIKMAEAVIGGMRYDKRTNTLSRVVTPSIAYEMKSLAIGNVNVGDSLDYKPNNAVGDFYQRNMKRIVNDFEKLLQKYIAEAKADSLKRRQSK